MESARGTNRASPSFLQVFATRTRKCEIEVPRILCQCRVSAGRIPDGNSRGTGSAAARLPPTAGR